METLTFRSHTRAKVVFWSLMGICSMLTAMCIYLAVAELGHTWGGFSFDTFGEVMQANHTGLVFFDKILAVNGQCVQDHARTGATLRQLIRQTPEGTPLTYRVQRDQTELEVTIPVQTLTWRRLAREFGLPLLLALGQVGMGALVFLLRPNTKRSWRFLGFCVVWFILMVTIYDYQSTHAFTRLFLFCWFMTSAVLLHLAFVFPEEHRLVSQYPWVQLLFYLPSLGLWGFERLTDMLLHAFYDRYSIGTSVTNVHTVYWGGTLLFLLAGLAYTARHAPSPVARRRAGIVCFGFAAGFLIPMGSESIALLFHINLPLELLWIFMLFLPLSITYAILRYNLFDIGVIVRRTLTYGILTTTVIGIYLLFIWLFEDLLLDISPAQSHGFPILFGLTVLFLLNPLRARIQSVLDRAFFRTRYDFRRTVEALSRDLTALLNLDEIAKRIVSTVTSALHVSSVALYLDDGHGVYRPLAVVGWTAERLARVQPRRDNAVVALIARQRDGVSRYDLEANPVLAQQAPRALVELERLGVSLAFPILFKDDLIGMLALGEKLSGAIFTEEDLELLRTLTNQSAIALANARAYRTLEQTNAELRAALRKVELLEHVKTHLGKFVPTSVRQLIERDPTAPALDKREQDVTVLFLDIEGYTSLSEALDYEKVNYVVEHYFSSFLDDIYANQGDINETTGDGLMIIFQHADPQAHACAAVRTALAIRHKVQCINAELRGTYTPITVNMGINTGIAAVGSTKLQGATGTRWTFTATGSITNLAARLGAFASGGAICVGGSTAERLPEEFELRALEPQLFKNMRDPAVVYEVLGQRVLAEAYQD
jgi:class 3 adenylate cyclase